jgi:hypothetical protein
VQQVQQVQLVLRETQDRLALKVSTLLARLVLMDQLALSVQQVQKAKEARQVQMDPKGQQGPQVKQDQTV